MVLFGISGFARDCEFAGPDLLRKHVSLSAEWGLAISTAPADGVWVGRGWQAVAANLPICSFLQFRASPEIALGAEQIPAQEARDPLGGLGPHDLDGAG